MESNDDLEELIKYQMEEDERMAIEMHNEIQRMLQQEEHERQLQIQKEKEQEEYRKQLEENRRIREEQDLEYKKALEEIAKKRESKKPIPPIPPIPSIPSIPPIPPNHFICPISNEIMENPIYEKDQTKCYEKKVFLKYLQENNQRDPEGNHVDKTKLSIHIALKSEIALWKRENPDWKK